MNSMKQTDVIVIGAGAAGLMCAIEAGKRGRNVLVLDHANKVGKKILMSGGGRCNFTNYTTDCSQYLSANPHFCKSALKRYTPYHFIDLVEKHGIAYHEKAHGQLFCDNKASDIVQMLLSLCDKAKVNIRLKTPIEGIKKIEKGYEVSLSQAERIQCQSLVIATGGLSIPTMGATPFGYQVAKQFGLEVLPTRAGLVPFTLHVEDKERFSPLSGVSMPCRVSCNGQSFTEDMLFTHRGLSGPAMLQISSYWQPGDSLSIDLDIHEAQELQLLQQKQQNPSLRLKQCLINVFPKRVMSTLFEAADLERPLQSFSDKALEEMREAIKAWKIKPNATEGYRTAEVTLGGVDTDQISSQTMEVKSHPGLFFIGEVLDVTGWLGGFNFQWAWASGWAAGQVV